MAADEEEQLESIQRLKAAVHYTVGKICEEVADSEEIAFSRQFIAVLSEATFKYTQTIAQDAEAFAKHAKRTTIQVDDIKLLVRKSPSLLQHMQDKCEELGLAKEDAAAAKKGRKSKK